MKAFVCALSLSLVAAAPAAAGPASGRVTSPTGTIAPTQAIAYVVRDSRHARNTRIEILLTDVPVAADALADDLDRHMAAINVDALRDRNYLLLWVTPPDRVSMNATYSKTMTQYLNDSAGGLQVELTTNTPSKIEGRVHAPAPMKTMDGATYTIDVTFSADVLPAPAGTAIPAGGGEPGRALTAFLAAVKAKNWDGIKAGLSPRVLPMYDQSYNTPAENADSAADIFGARLPVNSFRVAGGQLLEPATAVLEVEGDRFGSRQLWLVKMLKTGTAWQYDQSVPAGSLP